MNGSRFVDSNLFARLSGVKIRFGGYVEGVVNGGHRSRARGSSIEFAQFREYTPGDDIKHVDWKSFARSDRLYVKQFEDETNIRTMFLLDCSESMNFKMMSERSKCEQSCHLVAALSWMLIRQGDAVGLLTHNDQIGNYIAPRSQPEHFWRIATALEEIRCQGSTNLSRALTYLADQPLKRCNVVVFSDCLDFEDQFVHLLGQLRQRHFVSVFHVLDPAELEFPFDETTLFEDSETNEELLVDPRSLAAEYQTSFTAWREDLRRQLMDARVVYRLIRSDRAVEGAVLDWARSQRT